MQVYDFQARTEWILDLDHYIDAKHYGADINAAIAEDIAAGNCRITDSAQAAEHDAVLKELVGQLVEAGKWVFD